MVEVRPGIAGSGCLRLGGSAFHGFVRDQYTTLPDIRNRPLHMGLDLDWLYTTSTAAFSSGGITAQVRGMIAPRCFMHFESGSIQQIIYQLGTEILAEIPAIAEVNLEAQQPHLGHGGRTRRNSGRLYRCPAAVGCLGLRLRR